MSKPSDIGKLAKANPLASAGIKVIQGGKYNTSQDVVTDEQYQATGVSKGIG